MPFVFYDTETSGSNIRYDQVLQFAAIKTDDDFNEQASIDLRSQRLPYVIPHPKALEVTHITPQMLESAQTSAYDFAHQVHAQIKAWSPATWAGQNILKFDREIMRSMFWMNLLDPYVTSDKRCVELDILPVLRFIHTVDPTAFVVPLHPDTGRHVFKLDRVAPLNGFVSTGAAHDALVDVRATIYMAQMVRDRRPELFALATSCASITRNQALLANEPVLRMLTYFGVPKVLEITRVAQHPTNNKQSAAFNLAYDPTPWLDAPADLIAQNLFGADTPFQMIKANHQPVLMPLEVSCLVPTDAIDPEVRAARAALIHQNMGFQERVQEAMKINADGFEHSANIEEQIYDGFPSWADKDRTRQWHRLSWPKKMEAVASFEDPRLRAIATRLIFAHAPHAMSPSFRARIEEAVIKSRLLSTDENAPWTTLASATAGLETVEDPTMKALIGDWLESLRTQAQGRLNAIAA